MVDPEGEGGTDVGTAVVVTVAVGLIAIQAGVVAFSTGFGPFASDAAGPVPATTPEPDTPDGSDSAGSGNPDSGGAGGPGGVDGSTSTPEPPPYDVDLLGTKSCGNTCRDVTVRLTNDRNARAEAVVVDTRIYSGNTTDEDARVWQGSREVGTLEGGASTRETVRVSLSYFEALSVERAGGWVTVVTVVESKTATETFRERREVI